MLMRPSTSIAGRGTFDGTDAKVSVCLDKEDLHLHQIHPFFNSQVRNLEKKMIFFFLLFDCLLIGNDFNNFTAALRRQQAPPPFRPVSPSFQGILGHVSSSMSDASDERGNQFDSQEREMKSRHQRRAGGEGRWGRSQSSSMHDGCGLLMKPSITPSAGGGSKLLLQKAEKRGRRGEEKRAGLCDL